MGSEFDETKGALLKSVQSRLLMHALGLGPQATFEELKTAHIQMALRFHPDMAHSSSDKSVTPEQRVERFRAISEAWFVLSKSELRSQYDATRIRAGKMTGAQSISNPDVTSQIPTSFNTQRDSFTVALRKAGNDWKGNRDKYKCEVWHKLSHAEKKLSRSRRHGSLLGDTLRWAVLIGLAAVGGRVTYNTLFDSASNYSTLRRLRPKQP